MLLAALSLSSAYRMAQAHVDMHLGNVDWFWSERCMWHVDCAMQLWHGMRIAIEAFTALSDAIECD
jgi:hypothetical protein